MKKKLLVLSGIIVCLIAIVLIVNNFDDSSKIIYESSGENRKTIINSNALTMMYEIDYQSGEYQVSSDTVWPEDGYTFNETLSKCENGSKLSWDDENKRVVMQANSSVMCILMFYQNTHLLNI